MVKSYDLNHGAPMGSDYGTDQGAQLQLTEIYCRLAMKVHCWMMWGSLTAHFVLKTPHDPCHIPQTSQQSKMLAPNLPFLSPSLRVRHASLMMTRLIYPSSLSCFFQTGISLKKIFACLNPFWHLFSEGCKLTQSGNLI